VDGEALDSVYAQVIALADAKKEVTDADLLAVLEQRASAAPGTITLAGWSVTSSHGGRAMGMVSLGIGDQSRSVEANGNGPVDALYGAIDQALESVLGWKPVLEEYEIKAVTAGEDAQGQVIARVRRSTEEGPETFVATGHGLSTNIIEASVAAYLAGAEKLQQDAVTKAAILEAARASGQAPEKVEKLP
jgi:2-isopropylmalate synthase